MADPVSPFISGASAISSISSTAYYSKKSGCVVGIKKSARKKLMKNVKAIVISDIYRNKLTKELFSSEPKIKLLNIEKVFEITFPNETVKALRKIRITDYDTYICLVIKSLRQLLERYRYNNVIKTQLFLAVSSVKMAEKLGVKKSNIIVFTASEKLNQTFLKKFNQDIINYHYLMDATNEKGNKKIIKHSFESYDGLKSMILRLIPELMEHTKETLEEKKNNLKKLDEIIDKHLDEEDVNIEVEEESKGDDIE